jgi:hypothetical protein
LKHQLQSEEIKPNPIKVEVICYMKLPVDISGIQKFLGLTSYYRRFIKGFQR